MAYTSAERGKAGLTRGTVQSKTAADHVKDLKRDRDTSTVDELAAATPPPKKQKKPKTSKAASFSVGGSGTHDPEWIEREAPLEFLSECPWELPTKENQISNFSAAQIAADALETQVVMHPRLPQLFTSFLNFKRKHGSKLERKLYADMNTHDLVARLIKKRPLHFTNDYDFTVLRDGTRIDKAHDEWLRVGRDLEDQNTHIFLKDYLSYDEMMLSSLLGCSGPTYFINTGSRRNAAQTGSSEPHQGGGITLGLVGTRLHAEGQMDHVICGMELPKDDPCAQDPRLTKIFRDFFYPEHSPAGIKEYEHRTIKGVVWKTFDKDIYKGRIRVSIETALLEADDRAAFEGTKAHLFLAGLGLGVWRGLEAQFQWYFEEIADCLERLDLRHINVLELGWDQCPATVKSRLLAVGEKKDIKVIVSSKRDPCAQLESNDLLVRVWAWDSNSLPGNEYWSGKSNPKCLTSSDDPAAACCSTIAELHNPYVNPFEHRVKVLQERYCRVPTAGSGSTTAKAKVPATSTKADASGAKVKPALGKSAIKPKKSSATAASSSKVSKTSQKLA